MLHVIVSEFGRLSVEQKLLELHPTKEERKTINKVYEVIDGCTDQWYEVSDVEEDKEPKGKRKEGEDLS